MKNKGLKLLIVIVLLFFSYYLSTVIFSNHGQFVNYYHYPSNSILDSKENSNFLNIIPSNNIKVEGNEEFNKFIENDLNLWYDKFKVRKSFGLLNLFPYNSVNENKKFLRIGYKNSSKNYTLSYKELTWVVIQDSEIKSISTTFGSPFELGSIAVLKFYEDKSKKKPLGLLKILIE